MHDYRSLLLEDYPDDRDIGEVVGEALDRFGRTMSGNEILIAIAYFSRHRTAMEAEPRQTRREAIITYVAEGRDILASGG